MEDIFRMHKKKFWGLLEDKWGKEPEEGEEIARIIHE